MALNDSSVDWYLSKFIDTSFSKGAGTLLSVSRTTILYSLAPPPFQICLWVPLGRLLKTPLSWLPLSGHSSPPHARTLSSTCPSCAGCPSTLLRPPHLSLPTGPARLTAWAATRISPMREMMMRTRMVKRKKKLNALPLTVRSRSPMRLAGCNVTCVRSGSTAVVWASPKSMQRKSTSTTARSAWMALGVGILVGVFLWVRLEVAQVVVWLVVGVLAAVCLGVGPSSTQQSPRHQRY